jgi:hypothetical protein
MFNQVFENFRQATESTIHLQQEMFKTWVKLWPGASASSPSWDEELREFQKKWSNAIGEMLKRQREVTGAHFKAGLQNIEKAFQVGEAKTIEELRAKSLELWRTCFDDLRQVYEAQLKGFEGALDRWVELAKKGAACGVG